MISIGISTKRFGAPIPNDVKTTPVRIREGCQKGLATFAYPAAASLAAGAGSASSFGARVASARIVSAT
jgi:hypothetical protein